MKFLISALMVMGFSFHAFANDDVSGPCHDDAQKFCKDVKRGGGRMIKCMKEHESELSQACKDHRSEMKKERKEHREVCAEDMKTHCGDVKAGGGAKMKCMKENKEKFSKECQDSLEKMKEHRKRK